MIDFSLYEDEERKGSSSARKREIQVKVYLSVAEKEKLDALVVNRCTISDFIRAKIMGTRVPSKDFKVLVNEMRRQGGLLKSLVTDERIDKDTREALYAQGLAIHALAAQVMSIYRHVHEEDEV